MKIRGILAVLFISAIVSCLATGCLLFPDEEPTLTPDSSPTDEPGLQEPVYFEYTVDNGEVTLTRYIGTGTAVSIPEKINGMPVTSVGMYCFSGAEVSISSVYIPKTVKNLGSYMCYNVATLTDITFENPDNIEKIGYRIIGNTPAEKTLLENNGGMFTIGKFLVSLNIDGNDVIEIPNEITEIASGAFENVTAKEVVFHDKFENINPAEFFASSVECVRIESKTTKLSDAEMFSDPEHYIKCQPGSEAEKYALQKGVFYELIGEENAWDYKVKNGAAVLTKYLGTSKNVRIISNIGAYSVEELGSGENIFVNGSPNKVYIPKTVNAINENFACGAESLSEIYFENARAISFIGTDAFKDTIFENKTNVTDEMSIVGTILTRHFGSKDIKLPERITGIAGRAFSENVTSITINEECKWLADDMLYDCSDLEWIFIPNSITTLKLAMFNYNKSVLIKCDAVSYAASFAQRNGLNCEPVYYWDYVLNDEDMTASLISYTGTQKNVDVPSKIGDYTVTSLVSIRNSSIYKLVIPSTVTRIEDMFAYSVSSLEIVTFEDVSKLEYIGMQAFYGTLYEAVMSRDTGMLIINDTLVSFTGKGDAVIPDNVKVIAPMAFYKSAAVTISVSENCTLISTRAFASCPELEWVYIPDTVREIEAYILDGSDNAYIRCHMNSYAEEYARTNGYKYERTEYDDWAYLISDGRVVITSYMGEGKDIVVPENIHGYPVTELRSYCFLNKEITSLYIPKSLETIGAFACFGVTTLKTVVFENPSNIKYIGDKVFADTEYWEKLECENGIFDINGILIKCNASGVVELPYYIKRIAGGAFTGCEAVAVKINEGCTSIGTGVFEGMELLEWVYIPDGATDISPDIMLATNENALIRCHNNSTALEYAQMSGYKYDVVDNAFVYSTYSENGKTYAVLTEYTGTDTEVQLPRFIDGYEVAYIGEGCFAGKNVTFMYVPSNITNIGANICGAQLKTVIFEDAFVIENIAKDAFKGTEFENVTNMGADGLSVVGNIITKSTAGGDVELESGIKVISGSAFNSNNNVISVTVNEGCQRIDALAFAYAASLKWVFIPDSVTSIGDGAFDGTSAYIKCNAGSYAEQYAIRNNIDYVIENDEFEWNYSVNDGKITLEKYNSDALDVIIPSDIGGTPVEEIGEGCFAGTLIESVFVPSGVTIIGNGAFENTPNLTRITFENESSIESIGNSAFAESGLLSALADEQGLVIINNILAGSRSKGDVVLEENIRMIAGGAFCGNDEITSVTVSAGCTYIGYEAFADMMLLEWVYIPGSVTSIDPEAFSEDAEITIKCYKDSFAEKYAEEHGLDIELMETDFIYEIKDGYAQLNEYIGSNKKVIIPAVIENVPVEVIGDECFVGKDIEYVWIPATVKKIGDKCFYGALNLKTVEFADESAIEEIGNQAFKETYFENVTGVDSDGIVQINGILIRHFGSGDVVLPEYIRVIAGGAFFDRQDIKSVAINDGCEKINGNAFNQMRFLEGVIIPDSVSEIGDGAFVNCSTQLYIQCSVGSTAQEYAENNNISYRTEEIE